MLKKKTIIEIRGVCFEVTYLYYPSEPMIWNDGSGAGYPGSSEEVDIVSIKHKTTDFLEFLENELEDIEQMLLDYD